MYIFTSIDSWLGRDVPAGGGCGKGRRRGWHHGEAHCGQTSSARGGERRGNRRKQSNTGIKNQNAKLSLGVVGDYSRMRGKREGDVEREKRREIWEFFRHERS